MTFTRPSSFSLPHHDSSARYVDQPTPSLNDTVTVTLDLAGNDVGASWLRTVRDGEQEWVVGEQDDGQVHFELPCTQDVVNYRFHLDTKAGPRWLTGQGLLDFDPTDASDFRLVTTGHAPDWVTESVWYQIFPDRFSTTGQYRADNDWANWVAWDDPVATGPAAMTQMYGGDLDGIIANFDHLSSLGIGGIYLNPIFPARSNHRYDASTFDRVDPLLGGDEALARLSSIAADRNIKVMTDLTLNHTGNGHEWFVKAQADANSPEAGFYYFDEHPDKYQAWLGIDSLPKLDHRSAELRRRYYEGPDSVLARYLQPPFNMAGWRIDVANMTGRLGPIDQNQQVAKSTRATMDAIDPELWLVGEHFFDASRDCPGDGWHGVMNYAGVTRPIASWLGEFTALGAFMPGPGQPPRNGVEMARSMDAVRSAMPWQVTAASMTLLGSHDTARWRSMAANDDIALMGFGLLLSIPGTPTFLYGDEIGLTGNDSEQARRTMPWNTSTWDKRFLAWYSEMIAVRNREPALRSGGFRWVHVEPDAVVFLRETRTERLLVRAARSNVAPLRINAAQLGAEALEPVFNADQVNATDGDITLEDTGAHFSIWRLV